MNFFGFLTCAIDLSTHLLIFPNKMIMIKVTLLMNFQPKE